MENLLITFVRASLIKRRMFGTLPKLDTKFWKRLLVNRVHRAVKFIHSNYFLTYNSATSNVAVQCIQLKGKDDSRTK